MGLEIESGLGWDLIRVRVRVGVRRLGCAYKMGWVLVLVFGVRF